MAAVTLGLLAKSGSKKALLVMHILLILISFTLIVTNACQLGLIHQYARNFNPKVMNSELTEERWLIIPEIISGHQVVRRGAQTNIRGGCGACGQLFCLHPLYPLLPGCPPGPVNLLERENNKRNATFNNQAPSLSIQF